MLPMIVRYPLDPTGLAKTNLVVDEPYRLLDRQYRAFAIRNGAVFEESVIVRDEITQLPLIKNKDYFLGALLEKPSARFNRPIYGCIIITNQSVSDRVVVTYQVVGGVYSHLGFLINDLYKRIAEDKRPVKYNDIENKPSHFKPAHHFHDIGDTYGYQHAIAQMEAISHMLMMKDRVRNEEFYAYIDSLLDSAVLIIKDLIKNHAQSGDHDHRYFTKQQANNRYLRDGQSLDVTLEGPKTIVKGTQSSWTITNFDSFSVYEAKSSQGNCQLLANKITLLIPNTTTVINPLVLTITRNGADRVINFTI